MSDKNRSLAHQITCLEFAAGVLKADEETAAGLEAAAKSLAWTERNADVIRAVVELRKAVPGTSEYIARLLQALTGFCRDVTAPKALDALNAVAELSQLTDDLAGAIVEFADVARSHPEIVRIIRELRAAREFHGARLELTPKGKEVSRELVGNV